MEDAGWRRAAFRFQGWHALPWQATWCSFPRRRYSASAYFVLHTALGAGNQPGEKDTSLLSWNLHSGEGASRAIAKINKHGKSRGHELVRPELQWRVRGAASRGDRKDPLRAVSCGGPEVLVPGTGG